MIFRMFIALLALTLPVASAIGGEVRVLTYSKETSDSRCIGNPVTPLCAVETMEACRIWADRELCELVGFDYERLLGLVPSDYLRLLIYKYEFMAQQNLRDSDISAGKRNQGGRSWQIGDVAVQLRWDQCRPTDDCVDESRNDPSRRYGEGCEPTRCMGRKDIRDTYILRRQGDGGWRLVDDFDEPLLPEEFWNRK